MTLNLLSALSHFSKSSVKFAIQAAVIAHIALKFALAHPHLNLHNPLTLICTLWKKTVHKNGPPLTKNSQLLAMNRYRAVWDITWLSAVMCHLGKCRSEKI